MLRVCHPDQLTWSIKTKPAHSQLSVSFHTVQVFKHSGMTLNASVVSWCYKADTFLEHPEEMGPVKLALENFVFYYKQWFVEILRD